MTGINNVNAVGADKYGAAYINSKKYGELCVDPLTGHIAKYDPSLFDPNRKPEKDHTGTVVAVGTAIGTAILAFLFRGKIKNIPFIKTI